MQKPYSGFGGDFYANETSRVGEQFARALIASTLEARPYTETPSVSWTSREARRFGHLRVDWDSIDAVHLDSNVFIQAKNHHYRLAKGGICDWALTHVTPFLPRCCRT